MPKSRFATKEELSSFIKEMMSMIHKRKKKKPPLHTRLEGANGHFAEFQSDDGQHSRAVAASGGPLSYPIRLTVANGKGEEFNCETKSQDGNGLQYPLY